MLHCALFATGPGIYFVLTGFLVGAVYMLGELPNSFLKRRIGIPESGRGSGLLGFFFLGVDHIDSVLVATVAIYFIEHPPVQQLLLFFCAGILAHSAVNIFLQHYGYKSF